MKKKNAKGLYLVIRNWAGLNIGKSHCAQIRTLISWSASFICTPRFLTQD